MLYIVTRQPKTFVQDVSTIFGQLTYEEIQPYLNDLLRYKAYKRIVGTPELKQQLKYIACETDFGCCCMVNVSTSIQIMILAKMSIVKKQPICFAAGLVGDNFLPELMRICTNTDLVSLYCADGMLPQITCSERKILEQNLRKRLQC